MWKNSNYPPGVTGQEWQITGERLPKRQPIGAKLKDNNDKYRTKFIANATLVEDKGVRSGQRYQLDRKLYESNEMSDTVVLTGINYARNVEIGDSGIIVYSTTPSSGLFYFWKGWTENEFNEKYG